MSKKKESLQDIRRRQWANAARVHIEKILRYDPEVSYSIEELANRGMIRKRLIRQACIDHPNVIAVPTRSKTNAQFKWNGPTSTHRTISVPLNPKPRKA